MITCGFKIVKLCVTGVAAAYCALPACEALMVHAPPFTRVAVAPETVQTLEVRDVKLTGSPEEAVALSVRVVPMVCGEAIGLNAMVWLFNWPTPLNVMVWVAGWPFSALSVSVTVPVSEPPTVGVKLTLTLQLWPGVSEKLAVQSAGVPDPGTCAKLELTVRPGAEAESEALPMFSTVNDRGLSALVLPTGVAANVKVGGGERCSSTTSLLLPCSVRKMLPAPSTAMPPGLLKLPTIVWVPSGATFTTRL